MALCNIYSYVKYGNSLFIIIQFSISVSMSNPIVDPRIGSPSVLLRHRQPRQRFQLLRAGRSRQTVRCRELGQLDAFQGVVAA